MGKPFVKHGVKTFVAGSCTMTRLLVSRRANYQNATKKIFASHFLKKLCVKIGGRSWNSKGHTKVGGRSKNGVLTMVVLSYGIFRKTLSMAFGFLYEVNCFIDKKVCSVDCCNSEYLAASTT